MSNILVIVESPTKAKTISKFLGKRYTVKASLGHVRDLPKSQFGVDLEHNYNPRYITIRGKGELLKELKAAAKKATKILLAPDPDREGEAIAWHLQHILNLGENDPCRIEFNEVTQTAIQQAVKKPRKIDYSRVNAQQARRVLDRLVGYNLSPLLWRKVRKGLSAGRVQSVAVRLICDREEEIGQFIPEEYWSLTALFQKDQQAASFEAKLYKKGKGKLEIKSKKAMDEILNTLKGVSFDITKVDKKEKKRNPAPPFTTSNLQQEASRKINFPARKTMMIAQQLYEGIDLGKEGTTGLVTYIRSDSTRISEQAREDAREFIKTKYGDKFYPEKPHEYKTKGKTQNAHEAIRPTSVVRTPEVVKEFLSRDQYRLYKLIWERFVASQMSSAVIDTTSVDILGGELTFRATGSMVKFPGFMKLYIEGRDDGEKEVDNLLPPLEVGEQVMLKNLEPKQHFTQPPPRYNDATLIKTLEELGIGRPSTYAPTVETIQKRGYVSKEEKQFYPTEVGQIVVDLLKNHFPDIIDVEFTAGLEDKLDLIEEGQEDWVKVIDEFYRPFKETLDKANEEIEVVDIEDEVTEEKCELCQRNLVIKMGRYGKFMACPGFPDCRFTKPILEETGVQCPQCQGDLVARRSKKGRKFYGCRNYPQCTFVTWDLPTNQKCPQCQGMMVKKTFRGKGDIYSCLNESCKHRLTIDDHKQ